MGWGWWDQKTEQTLWEQMEKKDITGRLSQTEVVKSEDWWTGGILWGCVWESRMRTFYCKMMLCGLGMRDSNWSTFWNKYIFACLCVCAACSSFHLSLNVLCMHMWMFMCRRVCVFRQVSVLCMHRWMFMCKHGCVCRQVSFLCMYRWMFMCKCVPVYRWVRDRWMFMCKCVCVHRQVNVLCMHRWMVMCNCVCVCRQVDVLCMYRWMFMCKRVCVCRQVIPGVVHRACGVAGEQHVSTHWRQDLQVGQHHTSSHTTIWFHAFHSLLDIGG